MTQHNSKKGALLFGLLAGVALGALAGANKDLFTHLEVKKMLSKIFKEFKDLDPADWEHLGAKIMKKYGKELKAGKKVVGQIKKEITGYLKARK